MMKWKLILTSLLILVRSFNCVIYAQTKFIWGRILDVKDQAVPFVSIQLKGNKNGTISDEHGNFKITVKASIRQTLIVSGIGYQTYSQELLLDSKPLKIILQSDERLLDEVIIFPDSSLKLLISRAYQSIKNNYPQHALELTGFYRSYQKSVLDGRYLSFTEANLRVQQGGYQHTHEDAQVEVLKVRNQRLPERDSIDNTRYYGGAFMANWNDPVKMRESFLNPASFNRRFIYHLEKVIRYDQDSVYVVQFKSKDKKESKEGEIWIDKKTCTYKKIEWKDSDPKSVNPLIPLRRVVRNHLVLYQAQGGPTVLKYASVTGENYNTKTKKEISYLLDFVTTSYNQEGSFNPIPFAKRLKYGDLFSEIENSADTDFMNENSTIEMDSVLQKNLNKELSKEHLKAITIQFENKNQNKSYLDKIYKLARHFSASYSFTGAFYKPRNVNYFLLQYPDQTNTDPRYISISSFVPGICLSMDYSLNHYWKLRLDFINGLSKSNLYKYHVVGATRYFLIKKKGNPLFITASLGLLMGKNGISLGEVFSGHDLIISDENVGKDPKIYLGESVFKSQLGLGLEYRKKRFAYFAEVRYAQDISKRDILLFETRRNFLFKKTMVTDYPVNDIVLTPEDLYKGLMPISTVIGFRLGFR
ncbi:carboxypeptidase-like regulatory domain-containing protein [Dyadobacter sp. 3J3]|uniref:carboxypeptidase-like regulatory domain-containing protein n=1 Tax=Dyadobacter sp. 3J3 TaxID=2606600 RepID=UPI0013577932|nr:carboxypeptidase-like regulatory domain-containing protein [Dyadobacter sp. 3J3]